jgi:hypothetical protein
MRTLAVIASLLAATSAYAQKPPADPQPAPLPGPTATVRCAPVQPPGTEPPGKEGPPGQTTGQSREPLGERLAQSEGVLCPPSNIDPQMQKTPPNGSRTPVIPPPGSPGGDPTIRPK